MEEKAHANLDLGSKLLLQELVRYFINSDGVMDMNLVHELLKLVPPMEPEPILPGISSCNRETLWILAHYLETNELEISHHLEKLEHAGLIEISLGGCIGIKLEKGANLAQVWRKEHKIPGKMRQTCATMAQSEGLLSSLSSLIFKGGVGEREIKKEFEALWKIWPVKKDRLDALSAYRTLRKKHECAELDHAVQGYANFLKTKRIKEHFEQEPMYLKTFLHKERWKEYLDEKYSPPL
jgi:hypothetical protein